MNFLIKAIAWILNFPYGINGKFTKKGVDE